MGKKIKGLAWILLPLLIWAGLVIRNVPAEWGIKLAGLPLQMEGITGTIWDGQVANVVLPYAGGSYALGRLDWDLSPWSLLTLSPCADFSTELSGQTASGTACAGLGNRLVLKNTQVSVPAALAEVWAPVRVRGRVDAQIEQLTLANEQIRSLRGSGSWNNARYHNSQSWVNLGTIAFDLSEDGEGGIGARVFDIEGPLELDLNSRFSLAGAFAIRGNIGLRQDAPPELGQLLNIVAEQTRPGQFSVEWVGS